MDFAESTALLKDLIKIDTIGGNEGKTADYLADFLARQGIQAEKIKIEDGRYNLVAEFGDQPSPVLAFEGHQDVVGLVDRSLWEHQPFGGEIEDNRMYGRGTSDMKGGLAAEVTAMVNLKESGQPINGTIRFLVTIGEESSQHDHMQGAQYFAENGYVDDVDAMIVAEPASAPVAWLQGPDGLDPFELGPAGLEAVLAKNRGSEQYLLCFAHKGSLTYEIKAEGKAAHSSTPELGINAIDPLVQAYNDQEKYFKTLTAADPVLGKTVPVFTKITGGNQLNSVPAEASLFGKIRTIPAENNDDIAAKIGDIIAEINEESPARLSLNILGNKFPVASDPDSKVVRLLQKYGEQDLQQTIPTGGMKGGTDAAEYFRRNPKLAVAIFGPGNMTAHQVDEYLDLDNFKAFCQIYEQTAKDFFEE